MCPFKDKDTDTPLLVETSEVGLFLIFFNKYSKHSSFKSSLASTENISARKMRSIVV